jgi:hypothetical protein
VAEHQSPTAPPSQAVEDESLDQRPERGGDECSQEAEFAPTHQEVGQNGSATSDGTGGKRFSISGKSASPAYPKISIASNTH